MTWSGSGASGQVIPAVPTAPTLMQLIEAQHAIADEVMRLYDRMQTLAGPIDLPSNKDTGNKVSAPGGQLDAVLGKAQATLADLRELNAAFARTV